MKPEARTHRLADWLDLHELSPFDCRRILKAAASLATAPAPQGQVSRADHKLELETAWHSVADSMRLYFPAQKGRIDDTFEKSLRMLVAREGRSRAALTIDNGPNSYPTILYSFAGEPADCLVLAHEFAHALQISASEGRFVSPIIREVCAFVGEWALVSYALATDAAQHRHLSRIWHTDSQRYFNVGKRRLIAALSQPDAAYRYSWNYPIARYLVIQVLERFSQDGIWELFEGHMSVAGLLRDIDLAADLA